FQIGSTSFVDVPQLEIIPLPATMGGITPGGSAGVNAGGGGGMAAKDMVVLPFDRSTSNYVWSADEKYIYFTAQSNGGAPLYRVNIQSAKTEQLSDFSSGTGSYALAGGQLVFARTEVADPFELYSADAVLRDPG